jgi:hypothetical protein
VQLALQGAGAGSMTFADLSTRGGGTLAGLPVIISNHVPSDSSGASIVLFDSQQILLGQGPINVAVATQGSLQLADNPSGNSVTATATSQVSLLQTNSAAIRVERLLSWRVARPGAVIYLTGVDYSGT